MLADLADLLAATGNGGLDGEPIQLVERALAIDPNQVKALALKGSYAMTPARLPHRADRLEPGASRWPPPGDPIAQYLRGQLDEMRAMAAAAPASAPRPAAASPEPRFEPPDGAFGRRFRWRRRGLRISCRSSRSGWICVAFAHN